MAKNDKNHANSVVRHYAFTVHLLHSRTSNILAWFLCWILELFYDKVNENLDFISVCTGWLKNFYIVFE